MSAVLDHEELWNKYDIQFAEDYAEPGYSKDNEDQPIYLANWNDVPEEISKELEETAQIEWSDEWYNCSDCGKLVRCSADSYSWKPSYYMYNDCEPVCVHCIQENPEGYLEDIINDANRAEVFDLDLEEYGFKKLNEEYYESGHYGIAENPEEILEMWQKKLPDHDFVFAGFRTEQFRVTFDIYGRRKN